ncbi:hypothetical protein SEUCBS139899_006326 [Sporothrix eucalyptigena]|uniref:HpcH/HpaI aldolase/citrate lyase domain-containing protein n=1 Tax=Sporothrix eucalyptigena TaxID=1812306 RepID=A0ABP0BY36_9PEZI
MSFSERAQSKVLLGAYLAIESPYSAHLMGRAGFDWMLIDMEHSPLSARDATALVHALAVGSHGRCASLVRIPALGVEWVKWALDSGAAGVVAPMVQSAEEAQQLVRFARYPSAGGQRSFGPFNAPWADLEGDSDVAKYFGKTAAGVAVIAMVESREGLENAEAILQTDGISGVFIGPVDLRLSMGLTGADGAEPEYVEALTKFARLGKAAGKVVGIFSASPAAIQTHARMGFNFLLVAGDSTALVHGAKVALDGSAQALREVKL